ncbi:MAG: FG-GAP-like repeat-containing protein [Solirubrobacteraceae bacterium]|nr:FG-GAP-like repeat-containing protein [Solirubrobacteraceae bacterium]
MHRSLLALTFSAILLATAAPVAAAEPTLSFPRNYPTGPLPSDLAAADLNGDGAPDIVAATREVDTISVHLGEGDGTLRPAVDVPAGIYGSAVVATDVDGDAKLDLAVAGSNAVVVLRGKGDGTFEAPSPDYPVGSGPNAIAAGDLNGDGRPDLVTANRGSGDVSVLLSDAVGGYEPAIPYAAAGRTSDVALAKVDGDDVLDLVTAGTDADSVIVRLGVVTGSFGPFGDPVSYDTGATTTPIRLATADLDGDRTLDVVTANREGDTLSVLRGDGTGALGPAANFPSGSRPADVAIADLDGDARPDLISANTLDNGVAVLAGTGDGTFAAPVARPTGESPLAVVATDLDRDGRIDVVAANGDASTISVLRNLTPPRAGSPTVDLFVRSGASPKEPRLYPQDMRVETAFSCAPGVDGAPIASCKDDAGASGRGRLDTSTPGPQTYRVVATGQDGSSARATVSYVVAAPPKLTLSGPTAGAVYALGDRVATTFTCAAGEYSLGIETCRDGNRSADGTGLLDTSTPGPGSYRVEAFTEEGGLGVASVRYTVAERPSITFSNVPEEGRTYYVGDTINAFPFRCDEGRFSGPITACRPSQTGKTLDTATPGRKTFTVTAETQSGLSATKTFNYTVSRCRTTLNLDHENTIQVEVDYPGCVTRVEEKTAERQRAYELVEGRFTINGVPFTGRAKLYPWSMDAQDTTPQSVLIPFDDRRRIVIEPFEGKLPTVTLCVGQRTAAGTCTATRVLSLGTVRSGVGLAPPSVDGTLNGFGVKQRPGAPKGELESPAFDLKAGTSMRVNGMDVSPVFLSFGRRADGVRYSVVGGSISLPYPISATPSRVGDTGGYQPIRTAIAISDDGTKTSFNHNWGANGASGMKLSLPSAYVGTIPVRDLCFAASGGTDAARCPGPETGNGAGVNRGYPEGRCHDGDAAPNVPSDAWTGGLSFALPKLPSGLSLKMFGSVSGGRINRLEGSKTALSLGSDVNLGILGAVLCTPENFTEADKAAGRAPISLRGRLAGGSVKGIDLDQKLDFAYDDAFKDGNIQRPWRASLTAPSFGFKGINIGSATLGINGSNQIDLSAQLKKDFKGVLSVEGNVGGWLDTSRAKFNFGGDGRACIRSIGCRDIGEFVVSSRGLAVCINLSVDVGLFDVSWHPGAGVRWSPFDVDVMWSSCGIGDYVEARPASRSAVGQPAVFPVDVAAKQRITVFHATGATAPPKLVLTPPNGGTPIVSPTDGVSATSEGRYYIAENPSDNSTNVMVVAPAGGTWTVSSADAEHPVLAVQHAGYQPRPTATGTVEGSGSRRTLSLRYTKKATDTLTLAERGQDNGSTITTDVQGKPCSDGKLRDGVPVMCATVPFEPGEGPSGERKVKAVVTSADDEPVAMIDVATFRVAPQPKPARPSRLELRRLSGDRVEVRWAATDRRTKYLAQVKLSDGRTSSVTTAKSRFVIPNVADTLTVRVEVGGLRKDLVMGRTAVARLAIPVLAPGARFVPTFAFFRSGRAVLGTEQRAWLRSLAAKLAPARAIRCEGHSSRLDGRSKRLLDAVAAKRARTVCDALRAAGMKASITTRGFGATRPRVSNRTLEGRRLNARVEIRVLR